MNAMATLMLIFVGVVSTQATHPNTPGTNSNFEVLTGNFNYLPPLDALQPYGALGGKSQMVRTARGTTLFTVALWINETASLPPQTAVHFQYFHGSCEAIASGFNVQVQDPINCPWQPDTTTCSAGQVGSDPLLEATIVGNLDTNGLVVATNDWPVYLSGSTQTFSMVAFDPSFPPGYFKMGCAQFSSDRSIASAPTTVSTDVINVDPPAVVTAEITNTDLGYSTVRIKTDNFPSASRYEFVVRSTSCLQDSNAGEVYFRSIDCNLPGGGDPGACDASNNDNIVSGILDTSSPDLVHPFYFDFLIRADGQAVIVYECNSVTSPPGGCVRNSGTVACLDLAQLTDIPYSTLPPTSSPSRIITDAPTQSPATPVPTVSPNTAPQVTTTMPPLETTLTPNFRDKDGDAITTDVPADRQQCGLLETQGELCCLPEVPVHGFDPESFRIADGFEMDGASASAKSASAKSRKKSSDKSSSSGSVEGLDTHSVVICFFAGFVGVLLIAAFLRLKNRGALSKRFKLDTTFFEEMNEYAMPSLLNSSQDKTSYGTSTVTTCDVHSEMETDFVPLPSTPRKQQSTSQLSEDACWTPPPQTNSPVLASDLVFSSLQHI